MELSVGVPGLCVVGHEPYVGQEQEVINGTARRRPWPNEGKGEGSRCRTSCLPGQYLRESGSKTSLDPSDFDGSWESPTLNTALF